MTNEQREAMLAEAQAELTAARARRQRPGRDLRNCQRIGFRHSPHGNPAAFDILKIDVDQLLPRRIDDAKAFGKGSNFEGHGVGHA